MNIKITKEGETLTAAIDGPLDIKTAPKFSAALEGELQDVNEVILDLAKAGYTSSAGLKVLLKTFRELAGKGGKMVLKNVNESFYDVLKLSGFTGFLQVEMGGMI